MGEGGSVGLIERGGAGWTCIAIIWGYVCSKVAGYVAANMLVFVFRILETRQYTRD